MKNLKTLFKAKKLTSLVVLLVTLLAMTINLSSCSSKDSGGVKYDGKNYGTVDGIVYSGKTPLAGAVVTIKQAGQADRSFITGTTGVFGFNDVQLGAFSLVCSASLFTSQTVSGTSVSSQTTTVDILMVGDATVKTMIPDPKFEEALIKLGYDTAPVDGSVLTYRINGVRDLLISNITDLTGIQDFKALEKLYCVNEATATVKLTNLDLSKNTALKSLNCSFNNIATLDLSMNTALTELNCFSNPLLTTLNITKNIALKKLDYNDCSSLIALDLSQNTALEELYCFNNKLTTLDVSKNVALKKLDCSNNKLITLDVSKNVALSVLLCQNNSLSTLDVFSNKALDILYCSTNQLANLDVSKNVALRQLYCSTNQLTSLDFSKNISLYRLACNTNKLTILDLINNIALTTISCDSNMLTTLDISKNTALTYLNCSFNKLTTLDATKNKDLGGTSDRFIGGLYCNDNLLTTLNIKNGNNTKITQSNFKNNASGLVIAVDDVAYSKTNWSSYKDASAIYVSSF
jgi:hypothetical protein